MHHEMILNLKAERELRGVSLEEMSNATKIPIRNLTLFEANEFHRLPSGLFIKGFLKAYIEYLGLDPDVVYLDFKIMCDHSTILPGPDDRQNTKMLFHWIKNPLLGFMIISIILLMVFVPVEQNLNRNDRKYAVNESFESAFFSPSKVQETLFQWSTDNISLERHFDADQTVQTLHVSDSIIVRASQKTWVQLRYIHDGREILEALFPNDERRYPVESEMYLEIEEAESIDIYQSDGVTPLIVNNPLHLHLLPVSTPVTNDMDHSAI